METAYQLLRNWKEINIRKQPRIQRPKQSADYAHVSELDANIGEMHLDDRKRPVSEITSPAAALYSEEQGDRWPSERKRRDVAIRCSAHSNDRCSRRCLPCCQ